MLKYPKLCVLFLLLLFQLVSVCAQENDRLNWVKQNKRELHSVLPNQGLGDMSAAFDDVIGNAKVVALGESGHAIREVALFRNRLLEYLVKVKGFRAIALESGLFEGQIANRYIHGLEKDIMKVLSTGFTHNMGLWKESRALLEWMKEYNTQQFDPKAKIYFYGMDLPVFQDTMFSRTSKMDSPLEQVLAFIAKADKVYYEKYGKILKRLAALSCKTVDDVADLVEKINGIRFIDPDYLDEICTISYENLNFIQKKMLSFLLNHLINRMQIKRLIYMRQKNVGKEEYEYALQMAKLCRYIVGNIEFRKKTTAYPNIEKIKHFLGKIYSEEQINKLKINKIKFNNTPQEWKLYFEGRNGRERTMAENVDWIVSRHGKVLIYAHNGHICKEGYISDNPLHDQSNGYSVGQYLAHKYGKQYITIGQTMDRFVDKNGNIVTEHLKMPIAQTKDFPNSIEYILNQADSKLYVLDIRPKTISQYPKIAKWLNSKVLGRFVFSFMNVNHVNSFDAIVFIHDMQFGIPEKK